MDGPAKYGALTSFSSPNDIWSIYRHMHVFCLFYLCYFTADGIVVGGTVVQSGWFMTPAQKDWMLDLHMIRSGGVVDRCYRRSSPSPFN